MLEVVYLSLKHSL